MSSTYILFFLSVYSRTIHIPGKAHVYTRLFGNGKGNEIMEKKRQDYLPLYIFRKMDNTSTCSIVIVNDRRSNNLSIYKIGKLNFTGWFSGEYNQ